ncbi:DUF5329 family protein [Aquabacterium sp.]|uniref:DUF5329 family protein n=1 Tax=Aquabacterium sp. TaxID=1872578 RepID=UPI002C429235|nr:DUF5329 family protein [Aquabacterium sp.]HSW06838.1 DUF5329 family protein [Aquabacterium sp.]
MVSTHPGRGLSRRQLVCLFGLLPGAGSAWATPPSAEMVRIERLLTHIGTRRDMRMVRNGQIYDTDMAVTFLRRKLSSMGDDVKTAEEFIERIATRSSTTGQLYWVRLSDGRDLPAGDFLRVELARLDKAAKP